MHCREEHHAMNHLQLSLKPTYIYVYNRILLSTLLSPSLYSQIHVFLEMVFLLFFAVDATIQLLWLRPKTFFTTKRTVIKVIILVVLFTDAFVVVCRGVIHVRVLRCLRPFYFIDCYVTSGVRRSVFLRERGKGGIGWAYPWRLPPVRPLCISILWDNMCNGNAKGRPYIRRCVPLPSLQHCLLYSSTDIYVCIHIPHVGACVA